MYIIKTYKADGTLLSTSYSVYTKRATAELALKGMEEFRTEISKDWIYEIEEIGLIDW